MLFNTLYFVSLHVGQVKPKNNLPEAISGCLGQALTSNPDFKNTLPPRSVNASVPVRNVESKSYG